MKNKILRLFNNPRKSIITLVVVIVIIAAAFFLVGKISSDKTPGVGGVAIERSYETVARTKEKLRTDGNFKIKIVNAEFADFILVQGKRATPIEGKLFLVLNVEIENRYPVELYAFPVDFFRLVREDGSKFAPSVHQGTVQIRPEATKKSLVQVGKTVKPG